MTVTVYHNPKCIVSRKVLKTLRDKGLEPIVVEYMKDPPGRSDLVRLLNQLRISPKDLMREKEARQLGLNRHDIKLNDALDALARNPALIERTIVLTSAGGKLCTSPEAAEHFLTETMAFA